MTKKVRTTGIFLAIVVCLSACSPAPLDESTSQQNKMITPSPAPPSQNESGYEECDEGNLRFDYNLNGAAAEAGFYYVQPCQETGYNLWYTDYATQESVVVCANPQCEHCDETCNGWFPCPANPPMPAVWGDNMILVYLGNPFYLDVYGDDCLPKVEIAEKNGANRHEIARLSAAEQIYSKFMVDNNSLFFLVSTVEKATIQPVQILKSMNLRTGEVVTLDTFSSETMATNYFLEGCNGEYLAIKRITAASGIAEPTKESVASNIHEIMLFDREGNTIKQIMQWNQGEITEYLNDDKLFYFDSEGNLYQSGWGDTDDKLISKLPVGVGTDNISFSDYCEPWLIITAKDESKQYVRWICNVDTGDMIESSFVDDLNEQIVNIDREWSLLSDYSPDTGENHLLLVKTTDFIADLPNYTDVG